MFTAAVTQARVITIKCQQPDDKVISRADSVAAVTYKIDTATYAGRLGCSVRKQERVFCKSIRMDLSKFNKGGLIHGCGRSQIVRSAFDFTLVQEDEFSNKVTLFLEKNCQTGELGPITVSITNEISGEKPSELVASTRCEVVR